jgi:hypothetical protein
MKHNYSLLHSVFLIQNPSRNKACNDAALQKIRALAPKECVAVRHNGNLLLRKGNPHAVQPYFLAHTDQVHDYEPYMRVLRDGNILSAVDGNGKRCGVGGDDKCGIYLALMMLHVLPNCTAVFVRDEEVGCLGSGEIPLSWFSSAAFVLQADRNNGTYDVIRNTNGCNCASDEFMAAVLALPAALEAGHRENTGSVTDIGELGNRDLNCSMINISSGYHYPHSPNEIVKLDELSVALQLAYECAVELGSERWTHTPVSSWGADDGYYSSGDWSSKKDWQQGYKDELIEELELLGYDMGLHQLDRLSIDQLETLYDERHELLSGDAAEDEAPFDEGDEVPSDEDFERIAAL